MKENIAEQMTVLVERTLSEAQSHILNANAARTELRYDLAISDLTKAVELYAEVEADLPTPRRSWPTAMHCPTLATFR